MSELCGTRNISHRISLFSASLMFFVISFTISIASASNFNQTPDPTALRDPSSVYKTLSPDGNWLAFTKPIPDPGKIWKNDNFIGFCVVIWPAEDGKPTGTSFVRWDCFPAGGVIKCQWSPDSYYLAVSAYSSNGHSPSLYSMFVIDLHYSKVLDITSYTGAITDPFFSFSNTCDLQVKAGLPPETSKRIIDLETESGQIKVITNLKFLNEP